MYRALSNTIYDYVGGFFLLAMMVQYPISIGFERAFRVKTKWDCIFAGRHPVIEEVIGEQEVKDFKVKATVNEDTGEVANDYDASSSL